MRSFVLAVPRAAMAGRDDVQASLQKLEEILLSVKACHISLSCVMLGMRIVVWAPCVAIMYRDVVSS